MEKAQKVVLAACQRRRRRRGSAGGQLVDADLRRGDDAREFLPFFFDELRERTRRAGGDFCAVAGELARDLGHGEDAFKLRLAMFLRSAGDPHLRCKNS